MTSWIEKATEEILIESKIGWTSERKKIEAIIQSHAPVIDAEEAANEIWNKYSAVWVTAFGESNVGTDKLSEKLIEPSHIKKIIAQLITSNLDLRVDWVDGKAEWGEFELTVDFAHDKWWWQLWGFGEAIKDSPTSYDTQALAEAACINALKRIVCGIKE